MFKGVTVGFKYKMHAVKKHFPIELEVSKKTLLIRRFLGEKCVKSINIIEGVEIKKNEKDPEEIWVEGNDVEKVSPFSLS
jgi:large subunit ribosomal protein L9e